MQQKYWAQIKPNIASVSEFGADEEKLEKKQKMFFVYFGDPEFCAPPLVGGLRWRGTTGASINASLTYHNLCLSCHVETPTDW